MSSTEEPLTDAWPPAAPVLLFDGVCHLCQGAVRFVLRHERDNTVLFCSLQSPAGADLLHRHRLPYDYADSMVVIEDGRAFVAAEAVVRLVRHLRAPWSWVGALGFLPRVCRDGAYRFIARRRYRWFGRDDEYCLMPSPELRRRMLESMPENPVTR